MEIKTGVSGEVLIMELTGDITIGQGRQGHSADLDAQQIDDLGDALGKALAKGFARVLLDLEHVRFVDSSGIGALIMYKKHTMDAGGDLKLFRPRGRVKDVLYMVKLDQIFDIHEDESEAVGSFQ